MNNISIIILVLLLVSCYRENQDHPKMHSKNKVHAQDMVLIDTAQSNLDTTIETNKPLKNGSDLKIIRSIYESNGDTINFYDIKKYYHYLTREEFIGYLWNNENTNGIDSIKMTNHNREVFLRKSIASKIGKNNLNYKNLVNAGYIDEANEYKDIYNYIVKEEKELDELYFSKSKGSSLVD